VGEGGAEGYAGGDLWLAQGLVVRRSRGQVNASVEVDPGGLVARRIIAGMNYI